MSYVDDRETFFNPDEDTAMPHGMTAQYLNEVVDKRNGMEVVDNDGDVWGWVHDQHKNINGWVMSRSHDVRVSVLSYGGAHSDLHPDYGPYRFVVDSFPSNPDPAEPTECPAPTSDPVNPNHYRSHPSGVECIEITEHMNFNLGNTIKYVWRAGLKTDDPAEDIKKALWYLRRELSRIEGES